MKASRFVVLSILLLRCATPPAAGPAPDLEPNAAGGANSDAAAKAMTATRRESVGDTLHGVSVADPYRWLEDEKSPEVKTWMGQQDQRARKALATMPERDALAERLRALLFVDARGAPLSYGKRTFFWKKGADKEKAIWFFRDGDKGEEKVLLDPHTLSSDGSVSVSEVVPSWDGQFVAYMEKGNNADEATLKVLRVDGLKVEDTISSLRYTSASWAPDNKGFYYTWIPSDPAIPSNERMGFGEIRYHALGTPADKDVTLREKTGDSTRWQSSYVSKGGKFLILFISHGWADQEVYIRALDAKSKDWTPLAVGTKALYSVVEHKGTLYVASNDGAPKWRVFAVSPKKLARKDWKEIVPESKSAVLDDVRVVGGKLALAYLENASSKIQIHGLDGKLVRKVELPAIGTASALIGDPEEDNAYFSFSSFTYPEEIYQTNVKTGATKLFAKVDVPVKPEDFEVTQKWFASKDGEKISIFLVHKKGIALDGNNPTLLYGYGGFNISLTPAFASTMYPFIERGGVYAVANLRGGGEFGEAWHQAGMLDKKQNVFDDFIAAAEWLIAEKYTQPKKLGISGRSNGGLLVGAAMTQRPELYSAVVCGVPLLDMVRYHLFGIGKAWIPEYGSAEDATQFANLFGYSPYHRVKQGTAYPALLMMSADSDDRVDPMHARKFSAAIEAATSSGRNVLLRIESNSGHGGGDLRTKAVEQAADQIAFLLGELNG